MIILYTASTVVFLFHKPRKVKAPHDMKTTALKRGLQIISNPPSMAALPWNVQKSIANLMKPSIVVVVVVVSLTPFALELFAQPDAPNGTPYTVASRSAHETLWQRVEWQTNETGRVTARTNEFVEITTSLNYFDETTRQFQPSREEWEVYPDAIVARWGQHKVILSHNLADGVDVLLADGATRLVSTPVSLGFYDPVDGKQAVVAEVKPECVASRGAAPNEIVFRNCFDRIRGSIRYFYTKAGFLQKVVLEQKLELPEGFSDRSRSDLTRCLRRRRRGRKSRRGCCIARRTRSCAR
jgi:hypothetical protein